MSLVSVLFVPLSLLLLVTVVLAVSPDARFNQASDRFAFLEQVPPLAQNETTTDETPSFFSRLVSPIFGGRKTSKLSSKKNNSQDKHSRHRPRRRWFNLENLDALSSAGAWTIHPHFDEHEYYNDGGQLSSSLLVNDNEEKGKLMGMDTMNDHIQRELESDKEETSRMDDPFVKDAEDGTCPLTDLNGSFMVDDSNDDGSEMDDFDRFFAQTIRNEEL